MAAIRTVLGDIAPDALGVCDAHDHLFFRTPVLPGQELDDPVRALGELRAFAALGGQAVVQWTPWGLGGRREELPALSRSSGVHIVSATGLHQARHYEDIPDDLTGLFVAELASGAGMIKVAGAYHHLDDHARRVMTAAAEAHHATDAPIGVHLEGGTAALDTLDLLCGREGVPPNRVILGHMHRFPDTRIHRQVAEAGAFVAFDGPSASTTPPTGGSSTASRPSRTRATPTASSSAVTRSWPPPVRMRTVPACRTSSTRSAHASNAKSNPTWPPRSSSVTPPVPSPPSGRSRSGSPVRSIFTNVSCGVADDPAGGAPYRECGR
jgi:phosphotriesterase-related protein